MARKDIERFKGKSEAFLNRVFTPLELEYCNKFNHQESHLAARFCAKEAVVKALTALEILNISYNEIDSDIELKSVGVVTIDDN